MAYRPPPQLALVHTVSATASWSNIVPRNALLVASAPVAHEPHGGALIPVERYAVEQVLFGFEAQLRAFSHAIRGTSHRLAVAPLPEMFATPRSLAAITPRGATIADIVHLRFGPIRDARVLKGARNIIVLADDPVRLPIDASDHPFADGTRLPSPFLAVLTYAPRRGHMLTAAGAELAEHALAPEFAHADIESEERRDDIAPPFLAHQTRPHLHVRSFAEYHGDEPLVCAPARADDSPDWRRALALAKGSTGGCDRPAFVMVPWNLSNPGSIIPDLIGKLSRCDPFVTSGLGVVLFPFNATPTTGAPVADLVSATRQQAGMDTSTLRGLFIARLTALAGAHRLRDIFAQAWLEGDDPESEWTARRLVHLDLDVALIGADPAAHDVRFAIAPDEPIRFRLSDGFGERSYAGRTLTQRQLGLLLAHTREATFAHPPGPVAAVETARAR